MFFSCNVAFSSLPVFLPTILNESVYPAPNMLPFANLYLSMGYSTLASQALSAPPYLFSFVIVLLTASLSDRHRTRSPFLIAHALFSASSYLIIALVGHFNSYFSPTLHILIRYICVYPAAAGFFSAITLIITWTMDNQPAKEGKGTGMAILNLIGQCGPLVGTRLYPSSDGPWYVRGMAVCSMFMVAVSGLALGLRKLLQRENARSLDEQREGVLDEETAGMEAEGLMGRGMVGSSTALGEGVEKDHSDRFVYII